ncbi:MAG: glycosyl transferase [Butyrivibrio sp.]|nr:glycosyl transferase [Butyrivibrio sp.]
MDTKQLRYLMRFIPDKPYLKLCYRLKTHKKLNLKNPQTFNEKLQWLKLYDRKPEYSIMVDKYRVREYIKEKIGEEYLIPLVGGPYKNVNEIDLDALPEQFVLKCNHDSGSIVICRDKKDFDFEAAKKKLDYCLKHNFWYLGREWPYKNVEPCIIAEKYMVDESGSELKDYKVFNFDGKPEIIQVDFGRFKEHKRNLYDKDWKYIEAVIEYQTDSEIKINRPKQLEQMLKLARLLSKDFPFLRTDFYSVEERLYFGEITFFHESGFGKFEPEKYERELGEKITIKALARGGHC